MGYDANPLGIEPRTGPTLVAWPPADRTTELILKRARGGDGGRVATCRCESGPNAVAGSGPGAAPGSDGPSVPPAADPAAGPKAAPDCPPSPVEVLCVSGENINKKTANTEGTTGHGGFKPLPADALPPPNGDLRHFQTSALRRGDRRGLRRGHPDEGRRRTPRPSCLAHQTETEGQHLPPNRRSRARGAGPLSPVRGRASLLATRNHGCSTRPRSRGTRVARVHRGSARRSRGHARTNGWPTSGPRQDREHASFVQFRQAVDGPVLVLDEAQRPSPRQIIKAGGKI